MDLPGEVDGDEWVTLDADLLGDVEAGVVHVRAADGPPEVRQVLFRGTTFRGVVFEQARFPEAYVDGLDLWTWGRDLGLTLDGFTVNGVEVGPLVDAELDRRHPERPHLKDLDTLTRYRAAWPHVEAMWAPTIEWVRTLPEDLLHERVDGEFSFLQTLRHLVFGTDAWVRRFVRHEDPAFHALALAYPDPTGCWSPDGKVPWSTVGIDVDADPTLDEVLAVRDENWAMIRATIDELDEATFQSTPTPLSTPGYPPATEERSIARCLRTIVNEEWWHHQYARRDLAVLTAG